MIIQCFGTYDDGKYLDTGLDQDWRLWLFQVCTEWGYFTVRSLLRSLPIQHQNFVSPPSGQTAPPDQNMPRIISKLLTLGYESKICKQVNLSVISSQLATYRWLVYRHSHQENTSPSLHCQTLPPSMFWATLTLQLTA